MTLPVIKPMAKGGLSSLPHACNAMPVKMVRSRLFACAAVPLRGLDKHITVTHIVQLPQFHFRLPERIERPEGIPVIAILTDVFRNIIQSGKEGKICRSAGCHNLNGKAVRLRISLTGLADIGK